MSPGPLYLPPYAEEADAVKEFIRESGLDKVARLRPVKAWAREIVLDEPLLADEAVLWDVLTSVCLGRSLLEVDLRQARRLNQRQRTALARLFYRLVAG